MAITTEGVVSEFAQNAQTIADTGTAIDMRGYELLEVFVDITATITVTFEATVDGTNWQGISMANAVGGTLAATAGPSTGKSMWYLPRGHTLYQWRARTSGPSGSPSATVKTLKATR